MTSSVSQNQHVIESLPSRRLYESFKRFIDFTLSLFFIIVWAPALILVATAIKLESTGPVFYRQKRVGKNGKEFWFYKFRTMYVTPDPFKFQLEMKQALDALATGKARFPLVVEDARITRIGRFLRKTSLDELPQIAAVLRGDMSLVGPRPVLPYEWKIYTDEMKKRLSVTPGLTGLWQVSGRFNAEFHEMIKLDLEYIQNRSLLLDLKIMLKTVPVVVFGRVGW